MFISIVIVILILIPTVNVFANSKPNFFTEDGYVIQRQEKRPAINEDFAPDSSVPCLMHFS